MALGGALVATVPPGQPYDEPAHWANVLFYLQHHRMPILGEPGVLYEAQMGPIYYGASALILAVAGLGSDETGFYALRVLWLGLLPILALLSYRLGLALAGRRAPALFAAALVALNPLVLAMSASVQNDVLCMVVAAAASLLAVRVLRDTNSPLRAHVLVGGLMGVAMLTKVFALGLGVGLLIAYAVDTRLPRWDRARRALAAISAMAVVSGWWFVRNAVLYGDPTGQAGVSAAGYRFPALRFTGAGSILAWGQSLVSYTYAPTEYFRNSVNAPTWLETAAVASALGIALALLLRSWRSRTVQTWRPRRAPMTSIKDDPGVVFALAAIVVVFAGYAALVWTSQGIAPRLAFVAAPLASAMLVRSMDTLAGHVALGTALAVFVASHMWLASSVAGLPHMPYWIFGAPHG